MENVSAQKFLGLSRDSLMGSFPLAGLFQDFPEVRCVFLSERFLCLIRNVHLSPAWDPEPSGKLFNCQLSHIFLKPSFTSDKSPTLEWRITSPRCDTSAAMFNCRGGINKEMFSFSLSESLSNYQEAPHMPSSIHGCTSVRSSCLDPSLSKYWLVSHLSIQFVFFLGSLSLAEQTNQRSLIWNFFCHMTTACHDTNTGKHIGFILLTFCKTINLCKTNEQASWKKKRNIAYC